MSNILSTTKMSFLVVITLIGAVSSSAMHSRQHGDFLFDHAVYQFEEAEKLPNKSEKQIFARNVALVDLLEAAEKRHVKAMLYLTNNMTALVKMFSPLRPSTSMQLLALCENGNSFATYFFLHHYRVNENKHYALSETDSIVTARNPMALFELGDTALYAQQYTKALSYYEESLMQGFTLAGRQSVNALIAMDTDDAAKRAVTILRKLVDKGDIPAMHELGIVIRKRPQFAKSPGEEKALFKAGSDAGDIECMISYALYLSVSDDVLGAHEHLLKAQVRNNLNPQPILSERIEQQLKAMQSFMQLKKMGFANAPMSEQFMITPFGHESAFQQMRERNARVAEFLAALEMLFAELDRAIEEENLASVSTVKSSKPALLVEKEPVKRADVGADFAMPATIELPVLTPTPYQFVEGVPASPAIETAEMHEQDYAYQPWVKPTVAPHAVVDDDHAHAGLITYLQTALAKKRHLVEALFAGSINNKDLRTILNRLKVGKPVSTHGSHNSARVSAAGKTTKTTFVTNHLASSEHTNSNKLRDLFFSFGVTSANQLWP